MKQYLRIFLVVIFSLLCINNAVALSAAAICDNYCQQTGLKQEGTPSTNLITSSGATPVIHYDQCHCVLANMTVEQAAKATCNRYCKAIGTSQLGGAVLSYSGTPGPGVVNIDGNTVKINIAPCGGVCQEDPGSSANICNTYACKAPQKSTNPTSPVLTIRGLDLSIDVNKCNCK